MIIPQKIPYHTDEYLYELVLVCGIQKSAQ